jgi:D-glycero-alpha-D-manno-heptose-7-phosphate kinase
MALSLRTTVAVSEYDNGRVLVRAPGFPVEDRPLQDAPHSSPLGAFFLLAQHLNVSGVQITVTSDMPVRSGLGGSAAAIVAAAAALGSLRPGSSSSPRAVAELAYLIESALYTCGRQDHLAAAYGGVNLWQWKFGRTTPPYRRRHIADREHLESISKRLVVVFSGEAHSSSRMTDDWISCFQQGRDRGSWLEANRQTLRFWSGLHTGDWSQAVDALARENDIRKRICPGAWTDRMAPFAALAREGGCAARFAGGGGGGCIWAFGSPAAAELVRKGWEWASASLPGARVVDARVDPRGVVQWKS